MNSNSTAIGLVADRSGSMDDIRSDAEGGINAFLKEQRDEPSEARLWMVEFDTAYDVLHRNADIKTVEPTYRLVPRGGTALYRAMGRLITEMGEDLANMPEDERPDKVIFVTMTDGQENSSPYHDDGIWTYEKLQTLIKQQQEQWNWKFIFLSSEPAAVATAVAMGVPIGQTVTLGKSGAQYGNAMKFSSQTVSGYRRSGEVKVESNDIRDEDDE